MKKSTTMLDFFKRKSTTSEVNVGLPTTNVAIPIGTLQQLVETRWSSHFRSVSSLLRMFTSTVEVLQNIINDAIDGEHVGVHILDQFLAYSPL